MALLEGQADPLALAIAPPEHETHEERMLRERDEAQARRISEEIDVQIKADKLALKKKKKTITVLLLGQSESGKSTTLKNFQIHYAYNAWVAERALWRAVIHLNLVRTVNNILDVVAKEMTLSSGPHAPSSPRLMPSSLGPVPSTSAGPERRRRGTRTASGSGSNFYVPPHTSAAQPRPIFAFSDDQKRLFLRLQPLRRIQAELEHRIGSAASEDYPYNLTSTGNDSAPFIEQGHDRSSSGSSSSGVILGQSSADSQSSSHRPREFSVRSSVQWKAALSRRIRSQLSVQTRPPDSNGSRSSAEEGQGSDSSPPVTLPRMNSFLRRCKDPEDEIMDVICGCKDDIKALREDDVVRDVLKARRMKLEDSPGFFLDDVDRIASRDYEPSDDDVIRARLRTMGVQEHLIKFETGSEAGREWIFYDVGGARSCRAAWYPYFDDINTIIFLAPISCFDESLAEDRHVNRLDDSVLLWKSLCSCQLLSNVQFVLFLNKYDLLEKKLKLGSRDGRRQVMVKDYVPGYGERANDPSTVANFFREKFRDISKHDSPHPRGFYSHVTSVINTKATAITLETVQLGIMRNHLKDAAMVF